MEKDNSTTKKTSKSSLTTKIEEMNQEINLFLNTIDNCYKNVQRRIKMERFISLVLLQYREHIMESSDPKYFSIKKNLCFSAQNFMDFSEFNYAKLLLKNKNNDTQLNSIKKEMLKQITGWVNATFHHINTYVIKDYTFIFGDEKIESCEVKDNGYLDVKVSINILVE